MARADGRRQVVVWLSPAEYEAVDGLAAEAGVATGALLREAALWQIAAVAREVSAGRVRLRARSSRVPVPAAAASEASEVSPGGVHASSPASQKRCDVVRGGKVVGECVAPVDAAGYPVVDRAAMFRRATQR